MNSEAASVIAPSANTDAVWVAVTVAPSANGIIVQCAHEEDVLRAVEFARRHGLELAARAGGHSHLGLQGLPRCGTKQQQEGCESPAEPDDSGRHGNLGALGNSCSQVKDSVKGQSAH